MRIFLFLLIALTLTPQPLLASEDKAAEEVALPKIDMEPFNLSLINGGRVTGKVTLQLTLVVNSTKDMEFVRLHQPQVRSDFLSALTVLARQRFKVSRPIDPDLVSAYLTPYADARLGPGKVAIYVKEALISRQ